MKLKVAIIDDEPSIRETFKWHLEDLGHDVLAFSAPERCDVFTGEECGRDKSCCDAMLIDYHMPGLNGLDFLEAVRRGGCLLDPGNVLLMSGDTTKIDMARVREFGCNVVQKPISLEQLEAWLQEVMHRHENG